MVPIQRGVHPMDFLSLQCVPVLQEPRDTDSVWLSPELAERFTCFHEQLLSNNIQFVANFRSTHFGDQISPAAKIPPLRFHNGWCNRWKQTKISFIFNKGSSTSPTAASKMMMQGLLYWIAIDSTCVPDTLVTQYTLYYRTNSCPWQSTEALCYQHKKYRLPWCLNFPVIQNDEHSASLSFPQSLISWAITNALHVLGFYLWLTSS